MEIKVKFYGILAEAAGTGIRIYQHVNSFGDLRIRLLDDFPGILDYNHHISVNGVFIDGETRLNDGDDVVLLPFSMEK